MQRSLTRFLQNFRRQQGIIEQIVRVNHAGEYAAYKIYAGQLNAMKGTAVCATLQEMRDQEKGHLQQMERFCTKYDVLPTFFIPLYHFVAYSLGYISGRLGNDTAMACTVAIEEYIAQHYNNQIQKLVKNKVEDTELLQKLSEFRKDELHHQNIAISHNGLNAPFYHGFKFIIQLGCKAAIMLSTRI